MNIQYQGEEIEYTLLRGKRKTISISISLDQEVLVKAPDQITEEELQKILEKKAGWIVRKRQELARRHPDQEFPQGLAEGRPLLYQGREYSLRILTGQKEEKIELSHGELLVHTDSGQEETIRLLLVQWYYEQAGQYISRQVAYYNQYFKESINKIRIKDQRSRWGSCSSRRSLNFNWRLIMAPPEVADYVVVHEMCHFRYMNHSREFWSEVAKILPDYQRHRTWLREHGDSLMKYSI